MELIQSRQNPLIKHIRSLDKKKHRDAHGQFFYRGDQASGRGNN